MMVTIHFCLHRKPGLSMQDFDRYWMGPHADLVRRLAPQLSIISYVQHAAVGPEAALMMQQMRGTDTPFDGVAEISFPNFEALQRGNVDPSAAEAQRLLAEDELRFIDIPRSVVFFTQARVIDLGGS